MDPYQSIAAELTELEARSLLRRPRIFEGAQSHQIEVDGSPAANFSSNNYLGLADDPLLIAAAAQAMRRFGFGAGASRLIAGNLAPHRSLEHSIARWKKREAALLFNSGYQANVGLVSALVGPEDVVFSDELNHASLIDGCRLSRARVVIYRHLDPADLRLRLREASSFRRRLVLTDAVFSMDGDQAPLADLVQVARDHEALIAVDEAHAVGVHGDHGAGLSSMLPPALEVDLQMGTLGKALGGFGAYVAGRRPLIELLQNRARSFVFTTALPVPVVAAAEAAVEWLATDEGAARRRRLQERVGRFHRGLLDRGFPVHPAPSHIVPLRVAGGNPGATMRITDELLQRGVYAQGIRPPTVPEGTSRIRFSLMATHTEAEIERALDALAQLRRHFT